MCCGMVLGRWCRTAAALAVLAMGLSIGACERSTTPDAANAEDEFEALIAEVGPDWGVIEDYTERQREWMKRSMERLTSQEEDPEGAEEEFPDASRAAAAATAILEVGGTHEKTIDAAEFLIKQAAMAPGGREHAYRGAKALLEHAPDYGEWPMVLSRMHAYRSFEDGTPTSPAAGAFFEELASEAVDPVLRAALQYYMAAGLMESVNVLQLSAEDRAARRQSALDAAAGLSAGVEEEQFIEAAVSARTFAEAEADLINSIRHATVGSTPPELTGTRLDGLAEALSDYRGRVVLLDFWATWCKPCIAALPELRQLVADLPADRFVLLAISVDETVETVTEFMKDEPMPWANWHVAMESEVTRVLDVNAYPTYVLVDEQGEILARTNGLPDEFLAMIEEAVERGSEA